MSAYGVIDPDAPVMRDDESAEPPERRARQPRRGFAEEPAEPARVPGADENLPEVEDLSTDASGSEEDLARTTRADAQAEVDAQIEEEMRKIEEATKREDERRDTRGGGEATTRREANADADANANADANAAASTPRADQRQASAASRDLADASASSAADPLTAASASAAAATPQTTPIVSSVKNRYALAADAALAASSAGGDPAAAAADARRAFTDRAPLSQSLNAAGGVSNALDQFRPRVAASGEAVLTGVGTCDFTLCDKNAGPQYVDGVCGVDGGLGCKTDGCRFCLTDNDPNVDPNLPRCPPCVCAEMGRTGCTTVQLTHGMAQSRSSASAASSAAAAAAAASSAASAATAAIGFNRPDESEPAGVSLAGVPAPPAATAPTSVDGVTWLLTGFGRFESCADRCARAKLACVEDRWPATFGDFVGIVGRTPPEDGRDGICSQVLTQDVSRHCAHSVVALSGRCFFQSMHREPTCNAQEDDHSDCQHFCPCA